MSGLAWLAIVLIPAAVVILGLFYLTQRLGIPFVELTQDPVLSGAPDDVPLYGGYISHVGGIMWSLAAGISLFAGTFLNRMGGVHRRWGGMLLMYGVLTFVLLLDDLFMLHETWYRYTGKSQKWTLMVQGLLTAWFFLRYARPILESRWALLVGAIFCFGGSLVVDLDYLILPDTYHHLVEDGMKVLGILAWCTYGIITSAEGMRRVLPVGSG